jgi:hypothetical protein
MMIDHRYGTLENAPKKRRLTPLSSEKGLKNGWVQKATVPKHHEYGAANCRVKKALRRKWEDGWRAATRSKSEAVQQPPDKRLLLHKAEHLR